MNPYIQFQNPQDIQGLQPVFQNIAQQQAMQNAALAQQGQLVNDAGMTTKGKQAGVGLDPMAMAMALRKQKPEMMGGTQTPNWNNPYANTGGYLDQNAYGNIYGVGTGGFE